MTGLDDVFVERFWARLRRGQIAAAFHVFPYVLLGFRGCAVVPLALVLVVVLVVVLVRAVAAAL